MGEVSKETVVALENAFGVGCLTVEDGRNIVTVENERFVLLEDEAYQVLHDAVEDLIGEIARSGRKA